MPPVDPDPVVDYTCTKSYMTLSARVYQLKITALNSEKGCAWPRDGLGWN